MSNEEYSLYKFAAAGDEADDEASAFDLEDEEPGAADEQDPDAAYTEDVSDFDDLHPILNEATERRDRMRQQAVLSVNKIFPVEAKNYTVKVEDVRVEPQHFTLNEQRRALLARDSMVEPIKATVLIVDNKDGRVLSKSRRTLGYLPWMTSRHTFIMDGNEYSLTNQLRVKPGVYTRTRANGELESHFNLGRGKNFRLVMNPESGIFQLQYESTMIPLYPILRALGKTDAELSKAWGAELLAANSASKASAQEAAVKKLYGKLIHPAKQVANPTYAEMASAIAAAYDATRMNADVTRTTLQGGKGAGFDRVNAEAMIAASQKLSRVFKGEEEEDDRDALDFKTLHTADTFVKERIEKDAARALQFKLKTKLNRTTAPTVATIVPSVPLSKPLRSLITQSSLSQIPSQINPVEILDSAVKVTSLGEGGIGSLRAVPDTTREQHGSHLAVLDPVRTPESGGVGVDLRAAAYASVDKRGNLNAPLLNVRTNKIEHVPVTTYAHKNVAFREVDLKKSQVPVLRDNRIHSVPPGEVDYVLTDPSAMFSPTTSLVPMVDAAQGNRNIMGAKFQTQAVPLLAREAPLVQAQAGTRKGTSMESLLAKWHLPVAPEDGVVTQVDKENTQIVIKGDSGEEHRIDYADNFPFASKTRLHHTLLVKEGDRVKSGQHMADSNYTRNGELALGTNMRVAYIAYEGLNTNDAVVISQGAADKLTSEHQYKTIVHRHENLILSRDNHRKHFGAKYGANAYAQLDADGLPTKGMRVDPGGLIVAALEKKKTNADDAMLGKLSRSLVQPFRDAAETWDHSYPGEVVEVVKTPTSVVVLVNTQEPMGIGDKLCFDEETEVLTRNRGWVPVAQVTPLDQVCCLEGQDRIVYDEPLSIHHYPRGGDMYALQSQQVDVLVTAHHKNWIKRRGHDTFEHVPANEHFGKRVRFKKSGSWEGKSPDYVALAPMTVKAGQAGRGTRTIPELRLPIDTYCMLLGAFISEGNLVDQPDSGSYGIDITQIKPAHREHLLTSLCSADVRFNEHGLQTKVRVYGKQLLEHFKTLGATASEKRLPDQVFGWAKPQLQILFDWLVWGDGHKSPKTGRAQSYTTTSPGLADDVQQLALHLGFAANVVQRSLARRMKIKGKEYDCLPIYDVRFVHTKLAPEVNHGHAARQNGQSEEMLSDYDKPVHCITVPTHTLYVRRNGKAYWSGNSGRYGNKGVVSRIVPDDQMLKDEEGNTIEVLYTSAGVSTRINPNQVIETAVGKVAKKTGQPVIIEQFEDVDRVQWAKDLLRQHGVKDKETVTDPLTGRQINGILVGNQYTFKMFKSTDTNFSTRSIGGYDANQQPTKGGDAGAKAIGRMDYLALLAHDARANIQEIATVKSTQNDEYWKRVQLGQPVAQPGASFAFQKLVAMTQGAGINMQKTGSQFSVAPMTDADVDKLTTSEIETPTVVKVKSAKDAINVIPERGGLFDPAITGGLRGKKWSRVTLAEPVVNPVFEKAARELLDMNSREFEGLMYREGGEAVKRRLNAINVPQRKVELERKIQESLDSGKDSDVDRYVRQLKYLRALEARGLKAGDAYVISKVPVVPPVMRPLTAGADGKVLVSDPNFLYKDLVLVNQSIKQMPAELRELDGDNEQRRTLHQAVRAVYGTGDPINDKTKARGARGFLQQISGQNSPKTGYLHSRLIGRRQDLSGRGTIAPDPTLDLDQIGLPRDMLWKQFEPFIVRGLVQKGYTPVDAQRMIKDRTPTAQIVLNEEIKRRPVIINRAPTLHRYSMLAAYAKPIDGKTIRLNPFAEIGMNADYDGDAIQVHVPVTERAVQEAQRITLGKLIFADGGKNELNVKPQHEAIIGVYMATRQNPKHAGRAPVRFKNKEEAMRAYYSNKIDVNTPIEIEDMSTGLKDYLRNPTRRETNLTAAPATSTPQLPLAGAAAPPPAALPGHMPVSATAAPPPSQALPAAPTTRPPGP